MSQLHPTLFEFLLELKENNNRDWFAANKARYETVVRQPLLQFIADFAIRLPQISPKFVADNRAMFRIQRDVRFSKDKSPYKTAAAVQFRHVVGKDVHAPGFYLHLEPGQIFAGGGIWQPDGKALSKIREAIITQPEAWIHASTNDGFRQVYTLGGESLKNPPRGFDPDHPLIADLKRKDFVVSAPLTVEAVCAPNFVDYYTELCQRAAPFIQFLTQAMGLSW